MRRILVLTALILASATTWADNYLYYHYSTVDKTAQVTNKDNFGNKVTYSGDIDIPDVVTLDGIEYKVTDILPSTFYNTSITSVKLGNNIKQIHGEAFRYCRNLTEITIPASVDSIGAWAFSDCGIKNVKIEDGEMPLKLWDWAGYCIFAGNPLETVYLGRNYISNGRPFRGFTTMKSVTVSDIVTAIQSEEFRGSKGIREVKLGENITEIGKSAFYDCDTLYSITLPESVLTLGEYAFYNCDTLTWINIPSQVSFIGGEAFRYCTYLDNISIPASVDSIGAWAFSSTGIRNIRIEDGEKPLKLWEWAGYCIFASAPLETVYLGRNYISNGRPFRGFTTMKSVTVSDIVTAIQSEEFRGSKGIREVKLGENITEIGKSAFYDCDTLYSITLPESVLTLGEYAFYNCDTLTWINIPSNVNLIGGEAFRYCRYLAEVTIPASVDSIGAWAFSSTGLKNVAISDGETPLKLWEWAGYSIFSGDALESLYLGRDYTCNAQPFREFQTMKALSIGSAITSLQSGAFEKCSGLEKIFCYNDIPPTCGQKVFSGVNKQLCYLYVPAMSIDLYKAAYTWNEFFNVGETSVMNLKACENAIDGMWFDLNGRQMESSKPGLNILRTKNGKAIKVFIP